VCCIPKQTSAVTTTTLAPCPSVPIVTVDDEGRLGNKMWEYSSVWTMSRILDQPGYVPNTLMEALGEVFANLSLANLDTIKHCNLQLGQPVAQEDQQSAAYLKKKYKGKNVRLRINTELPNLTLHNLGILEKVGVILVTKFK